MVINLLNTTFMTIRFSYSGPFAKTASIVVSAHPVDLCIGRVVETEKGFEIRLKDGQSVIASDYPHAIAKAAAMYRNSDYKRHSDWECRTYEFKKTR